MFDDIMQIEDKRKEIAEFYGIKGHVCITIKEDIHGYYMAKSNLLDDDLKYVYSLKFLAFNVDENGNRIYLENWGISGKSMKQAINHYIKRLKNLKKENNLIITKEENTKNYKPVWT